jgi:uncharacterized protein (TIGR03000 family)
LLAPGIGSAQFFRPVLGGFGSPWGYPGFGYGYGYNPYPIGNFPYGTTFYGNLAPYGRAYMPAYYPPYTPTYTPPYTAPTYAAAGTPYRPRITEYNANSATTPEETRKDKAASSVPSSNGIRAAVREYNVPKETAVALTVLQQDQPARIDVEVPAKAALYCDGTKTSLTGTLRRFVTPALSPGREYSYEFKAEWKDGDTTVSVTQHVSFRAGDRVPVTFLKKTPPIETLPKPKSLPL